LAVHALRRHAQGQPPGLRRGGPAGGRRAALRARVRAPGRAPRPLRRAHGRGARQRRAGDSHDRGPLGLRAMPPVERPVCQFAAEPPQSPLPHGRWADTLQAEFMAACLRVKPEEGDDVGTPGTITWFPDRTFSGRTYVPGTAHTSTGMELF